MKETKEVDGLDSLLAPPHHPDSPLGLGQGSVVLGTGVRLEPARSRVSNEHESQRDRRESAE